MNREDCAHIRHLDRGEIEADLLPILQAFDHAKLREAAIAAKIITKRTRCTGDEWKLPEYRILEHILNESNWVPNMNNAVRDFHTFVTKYLTN